MKSDTGDIRKFVSEEEAKKAGYKEPLTEAEAYYLENVALHTREMEIERLRKEAEKKDEA
jgi:hypothetical protein